LIEPVDRGGACAIVPERQVHPMAAPSSHISIRKIDGVTRIDFVDRNILDELNIHQIGEELLACVESEMRPKVVIVFENVDHLSSAAFGTLMKFLERVKVRDGQLRLCAMKPRVYEGFTITKLNRIFSIHADFAAAVESFK
jgi:anti-anti-sigma factor